jgi:hypothetical protein
MKEQMKRTTLDTLGLSPALKALFLDISFLLPSFGKK